MNDKTKNVLLVALIVGLVSMTVVYATLTQVLNINTTAKIVGKDASWNVHFNAPSDAIIGGYASVAEGKELKLNGTTTLYNLEATLKAPGDSVSYTFDVENSGTIDAVIDSVTLPDIANLTITGSEADVSLVKSNLEFSLVYDGTTTTPAKNDELKAGASRKLRLTISYKSTATDIPSTTITVSGINSHIDYKQA